MEVICPYCGNQAKLVDSAQVYGGKSYGLIWLCKPCDAYVGTHKNSAQHTPLGTLANKELRSWRNKAHAAFDPLWKKGSNPKETNFLRRAAYIMMQQLLGKSKEEAHIGKFSVEECKLLIKKLEDAGHIDKAPWQRTLF